MKARVIVKVIPGGPAARAQLQGVRRDASGDIRLGDVIVAADSKAIANADNLNVAIEQHKIRDTVTLTGNARWKATAGSRDPGWIVSPLRRVLWTAVGCAKIAQRVRAHHLSTSRRTSL